MTKAVFITATGTDVGKTYISALIVKKMRELGYNCGYFKPALSGAEIIDGKIIPSDCNYVLKQAGIDAPPENYVSYVFKTAVSPHLASEIENNPIKIEKIKSDFARIKKEFDYIVVEGAGGIVCPFNLGKEKIMLPDVIKTLGLDIVIVASASLGTINSTILTAEYAKNNGIKVRGIILNNYDENDLMQKDNKIQVEALTGIKVIAAVKKGEKDIKDLSNIFNEV
ncbi:aTP-dependent dethiobiotin synthetase BioD [Fusobacterium sp. CAG:439]|nr:aTP-dependent dethiobiotin synthetase BioD [Fusobacterium sp. CAG:439]